jgi:CRP/FNR family transcriptional regulator, cyclic AMP receptor protein
LLTALPETGAVMNPFEPVGYLASLLVLATFCMRDMVALRVVAIASNLAFIAYSGLAQIGPVLLLHALLLPVNVLRLVELRAASRRCPAPPSAAPPKRGVT